MNQPNLTNKQLSELDSLFELVSQRQTKDFGNISASNKADGSLLTSCDLWSDKTIVDGLASIAPGEGVLSEEGQKLIPNSKAYWVVDPLDGTTNFAAGIPYWSISVARFVDGKPQSSFLIIPFSICSANHGPTTSSPTEITLSLLTTPFKPLHGPEPGKSG